MKKRYRYHICTNEFADGRITGEWKTNEKKIAIKVYEAIKEIYPPASVVDKKKGAVIAAQHLEK